MIQPCGELPQPPAGGSCVVVETRPVDLVMRLLVDDTETRRCVVKRQLGRPAVADFESIERVRSGDAPAHRLVAPLDDDVSQIARRAWSS